jgi:DNA-binding IclR family transcriptional regulator
MSHWHKKETEFEQMDCLLQQTPGLTATEIAKQLGVSPSTVLRRLPGMNEAGYLLSEDKQGRLWPFGRKK